MKVDLDKVIFIGSEYHQYHGGETYRNAFAKRVADVFRQQLEKVAREDFATGSASIGFHNNREVKVKVDTNVRGRHVYYFHEFRGRNGEYDPDVGYAALFMVEDAVTNVGRAESITIVAPHLPYLRGDWAPESRVPIPAKVYAQLTEAAAHGKLHHMITADMHSFQAASFYSDIHPDNLSFHPVFLPRFRDVVGDLAAVALDAGGAKRARKLAQHLAKAHRRDYIPTILIDKSRPRDGDAEVMAVVGDPAGKVCIASEDMIDTGGTAAEGARALLERGAKEVYICATHGIFSQKYDDKLHVEKDPMEALRASGARLIISDSLPLPDTFLEANRDFVERLSLAPIMANTIYEIETNGSVSKLYPD